MILDHADCNYMWFFVFANVKQQENMWLPLNTQKLEMFQLQGGFATWFHRPGPLSFAYCSVNTVSLKVKVKVKVLMSESIS